LPKIKSVFKEFAQGPVQLETHLIVFCGFRASPLAGEHRSTMSVGERITRLKLNGFSIISYCPVQIVAGLARSGNEDQPRWSTSGRLLYFISARDGSQCIWAQRLIR